MEASPPSRRYRGVRLLPSGKWNAYIYINGVQKSLGYFERRDEAARAYDFAAIKAHKTVVNFPEEWGSAGVVGVANAPTGGRGGDRRKHFVTPPLAAALETASTPPAAAGPAAAAAGAEGGGGPYSVDGGVFARVESPNLDIAVASPLAPLQQLRDPHRAEEAPWLALSNEYAKFFEGRGMSMPSPVQVRGVPLSTPPLFAAVMGRGGCEAVDESNAWEAVASEVLPSQAIDPQVAAGLKSEYERVLRDFELESRKEVAHIKPRTRKRGGAPLQEPASGKRMSQPAAEARAARRASVYDDEEEGEEEEWGLHRHPRSAYRSQALQDGTPPSSVMAMIARRERDQQNVHPSLAARGYPLDPHASIFPGVLAVYRHPTNGEGRFGMVIRVLEQQPSPRGLALHPESSGGVPITADDGPGRSRPRWQAVIMEAGRGEDDDTIVLEQETIYTLVPLWLVGGVFEVHPQEEISGGAGGEEAASGPKWKLGFQSREEREKAYNIRRILFRPT